MRSGEIVIMRTCDLDTTGAVWVYTPVSHKTAYREKDRPIFIGPRAIRILKPWLRLNVEEYLFQPKEAMAERWQRAREQRRTKVQPSQADRRLKRPKKKAPRDHYDSRSYYQAIKRACKKAGVPHWHPHQLRHRAATLLRQKFDLDVARVILGHSSVNATAIYAESDRAKAAAAIARVG
jgi:integrase